VNEQKKTLVAIANPEYVRSARVPRIRREPNGRKSRKGVQMTPEQKAAKAKYMKTYRAKNRRQINAKRRETAQKNRYLDSAIYRESVKRFGERRGFIAKHVDNLYKLIYIDGIAPDEARQIVSRPQNSRYVPTLADKCKIALDAISTMSNTDSRTIEPFACLTKDQRRRYTRANL